MTRITSGTEQPDVDLSHTAAAGGADHLTGRKVIARDVAVGRHGPTGKTIQFAGIDKVLLAPRPGTDDDLNGVEAYQCVTCGQAYDTVHSAAAHRIKHSNRSNAPDYPLGTLRALLRLIKMYQRAGRRNFATLTADELNRIGVETLSGKPWNAAQVLQLYSRWHDKIRVYVPHTPPSTTASRDADVEVAEVAASSAFDSADRLVKSFRQTEVALERLRSKLRTLEPTIAELEAVLQSAVGVDDDTRDKAQRWDEIQKLLGR